LAPLRSSRAIQAKVLAVSLCFGLGVWVAEAVIDAVLMQDQPFLDVLILDVPKHDLAARGLLLVCFLAFGGVVSLLFARAVRAEKGMHDHETVRVFRDVTEEERKERQIADTNAFMEAMLNSITDGIIVLDPDMTIRFANPVVQRMYGSQTDLKGKKCYQLYHNRGEPCQSCPVTRCFGSRRTEAEILAGPQGAESSWFRVTVHPIIDSESGELTGAVEFVQDITGIIEDREALRKAKEDAEAANRAKTEFLANMSHEIRTPLNGIMGMVQLIQTTAMDDEQKEYAFLAVQSVKRLSRLLSDILDLSRVEAGRMDLYRQEFNVGEVMATAMDIFSQAAIENGNILSQELDHGLPPVLVGDSTRLSQILFNLVGNAVKYTFHGRIVMRASGLSRHRDSCRILFEVSDTGPGIPEDKLDVIFETFTQGDATASPYARQFEGAGLGLPLVKRLVRLLGGTACITSKEGEGTSVYISLPFARPGLFATASPVVNEN